MFVPGRSTQFERMKGALGYAPALLTSIPVKNTTAYSISLSPTKENSFVKIKPGVNVTKLLSV